MQQFLVQDDPNVDRDTIEKHAPWSLQPTMEGFPATERNTAYRRALEDERACQASILSKALISDNLKVISSHIPSFWHSQRRLSPLLLIRLAEDLEAVFERAAVLRTILPENSMPSLLGQRPELLLHEDYIEVAPAMEGLQGMFPKVDVGLAVSRQPFFLVSQVTELIEELKQLPQAVNAAHQAHFMMMHLPTSAIMATETYKHHRKRTLLAYSKPNRGSATFAPILEA